MNEFYDFIGMTEPNNMLQQDIMMFEHQQSFPQNIQNTFGLPNINQSMMNMTKENCGMYNSTEGFVRGNMFPQLFDPYKKQQIKNFTPRNEKERMMLEIQQLDFAMKDINLYLDVNPNNTCMIRKFNEYLMRKNRLVQDYETRFGPITLTIPNSSLEKTPWSWLETKSPWKRMWVYEKKLQYPVNIKKKDLRMAKLMLEQYGGGQSELAATLRYLNQRWTMPDEKGRTLLSDIATEEMAHIEIVAAIINQLTEGATIEELKAAGFDTVYAGHGMDLFPTDANGYLFNVAYFAAVGDPVSNLYEDMAAEQKARAVYENLIDLATDPDVIEPLQFLRQREIVHFTRFKELAEEYEKKGYRK